MVRRKRFSTFASEGLLAALGTTVMVALLVPGMAQAAQVVAEDGQGSLFALVAAVMGFGALGGFVDGLTTDIVYRVNIGTRSLDIGTFGDIFAGSTAAIAIFTVGNALFPGISLKTFGTNLDDSMRIIAISVLSGYAGVRLLNPLTRKLVEQISTDKAREVSKSIKARNEEVVIAVKDGEKALYRYDIEAGDPAVPRDPERAERSLEEADKSFEIALRHDPLDTEALMGRAKVARRRAQLHEGTGQSGEADWALALQLLDRITTANPRAARAHYNKACYKQIRQRSGPSEEAMRDLRTALELQPELRSRAALDSDFAGIRESEAFKGLIGPSSASL